MTPHRMLVLAALSAMAANAAEYEIATAGATVTMRVDPVPPYTGSRFAVFVGSKEVPVAAEAGIQAAMERFVGAAALIQYSVRYTGRKRGAGMVHERVVLLEQSEGLPERTVFEKTVKLVKGVASDLQLFGYDEAAVPLEQREAARAQAAGMWRRYRQQLFLDGAREPFAVIEWRHTIREVRLETLTQPQSLISSPAL